LGGGGYQESVVRVVRVVRNATSFLNITAPEAGRPSPARRSVPRPTPSGIPCRSRVAPWGPPPRYPNTAPARAPGSAVPGKAAPVPCRPRGRTRPCPAPARAGIRRAVIPNPRSVPRCGPRTLAQLLTAPHGSRRVPWYICIGSGYQRTPPTWRRGRAYLRNYPIGLLYNYRAVPVPRRWAAGRGTPRRTHAVQYPNNLIGILPRTAFPATLRRPGRAGNISASITVAASRRGTVVCRWGSPRGYRPGSRRWGSRCGSGTGTARGRAPGGGPGTVPERGRAPRVLYARRRAGPKA